MKLQQFKRSMRKYAGIAGAIAILLASLPLSTSFSNLKAEASGDRIDFEGKGGLAIVEGNDSFSITGQNSSNKDYFYAKNNTPDTLTITLDDIHLKAGKKYTLDFDVYTLRFSEDADNRLVGLKLYGENDCSLEANVTNDVVFEEKWANYHTEFVAKESENKLDFSLYTIGKVFLDHFVLIDEKGAEMALDYKTACDNTALSDHFSYATLYEIEEEDPDIVNGYIKAEVPENSNMIHNEGLDIMMNLPDGLAKGMYTLNIDMKFTALGSNRIAFCAQVRGMGVPGEQVFLDAKDTTLNQYQTYTFQYDLTPDYKWFTLNVYQGCTVCIDNFVFTDSSGKEVLKFDFEEPFELNNSCYVQKGLPKGNQGGAETGNNEPGAEPTTTGKALLIDTTSVADNGSSNQAFWFNELGMKGYYGQLKSGQQYTITFDVYPLKKSTKQTNFFHYRSSSGSASVHAGWWGSELNIGEWQTTGNTFTVSNAADTGNHVLYVYGGFKGYIDNVRLLDSTGKEVAGTATDFEDLTVPDKYAAYLTITGDTSGNTTNLSTGKALLIDTTSVADNGSSNQAFWFNELGMKAYYGQLKSGQQYTITFDVYPLKKSTGKVDFFHYRSSSGKSSTWGGWWGSELSLEKWQTTSNTFTVSNASDSGNHVLYVYGGFKGYIDNVRLLDSTGKEVTGTATDFEDLTVPDKYAAYLTLTDSVPGTGAGGSGGKALLIDTTSVADDGNANQSFWFNELGMKAYSGQLKSGQQYTITFDVYPLKKSTGKVDFFHYRSSSGKSSTWGGWWGSELSLEKWQTTGNTFTVSNASDSGNHVLYVYGGFKGYIDNVRLLDSTGKEVTGTATDFEDLTVPTKYAAYLTLTDDVPGKDATEPDDEELGTMQIAILRGRAGQKNAAIQLGGEKSPLTLKSNQAYKLSFQYYQANPCAAGLLDLFELKTDSAVLGSENDAVSFKKNNSTGWTSAFVTFVTGDVQDTKANWLELVVSKNAWVYFDNFRLTEQEIDNNKAIKVVDFEKPDDSIYPASEDGIFSQTNQFTGTSNGSKGFFLVNNTHKLPEDKSENAQHYNFKGITLKSNTTYRISIDYYVSRPFRDYGLAFGYSPVNMGVDSSGQAYVAFANNQTTTGWKTLSYTVTTGEVVPNASYIKLAVYDNAAGNRQFYMDNLTLTELYKVDTSLNNPRLGTVSRAVTAEGGDDARVVATPFDGAVFEGWYEYGDLVSTDRIYRIRKIDDNHKLQAVFSGKAVKPTTVVQGFEDFDCGNVLYEYYEIVDDPANVYEGKKSLHVKDDKIEIEGDFSVFFPLVSSVEDQMKSDAIYDVYVWIKPARKAESKTYFQVVHSDICNSGDLVLTRLGSGIQMNITPSANGALEVDNGWCKYLVGTVTKTVASREGFGIQVCKFHAFRAEGASIDDLYIDRVELAERVPDYANLKFSEKLFNEIPNSDFESPITEQNWAPLTSGLSVEKVTDREYDWQGDHLLQFDAAKSNGEEYVKIIPISTKDKIYTFAAWAKLSKGSDIRVGFYRNGQYEPFENVVNGETGTLPLVDDGKWNRVSFTFNSGENENGYLVIKGTKGTLQLDLVELFFGNKGYASDPNGYGASKATLQMVDPLAFPDITRTVTTYLDDGDDYFEEPVIDEPENTDTKKSTNQKTVKKYRVIKRHHSDVPWLWIVIGILILAALVTGFIILFKRRKKKEKEESK